jgi:hypothetical protein
MHSARDDGSHRSPQWRLGVTFQGLRGRGGNRVLTIIGELGFCETIVMTLSESEPDCRCLHCFQKLVACVNVEVCRFEARQDVDDNLTSGVNNRAKDGVTNPFECPETSLGLQCITLHAVLHSLTRTRSEKDELPRIYHQVDERSGDCI